MYLLGIDFETCGLDPEKDRVIEVGAALWNTETKKATLVYNALIKGIEVSPEITKLTGISNEELSRFGKPPEVVFLELLQLYFMDDAIVAHNGTEFDRKFFQAEIKRLAPHPNDDIDVFSEFEDTKPWIDTLTDVDFEDDPKHKNLTYLSAVHGFVNPFPHRAFSDALSMLKILSNYDINAVLDSASKPIVTLWANVHISDKDKPKGLGYRWEPLQKRWLKKVKEHKVQGEMDAARKLEFVPVVLK